jgi:hypothetical protein
MRQDDKLPKFKLVVLLMVYIGLVIGLAVYLYS